MFPHAVQKVYIKRIAVREIDNIWNTNFPMQYEEETRFIVVTGKRN